MPRSVSSTDRAIIRLLQQNARASFAELSRQTNIPESTVRRRMERLQELGVIEFSMIADPSKLGYQLRAIIGIRVDVRDLDSIAATVREMDEVAFAAFRDGQRGHHHPRHRPASGRSCGSAAASGGDQWSTIDRNICDALGDQTRDCLATSPVVGIGFSRFSVKNPARARPQFPPHSPRHSERSEESLRRRPPQPPSQRELLRQEIDPSLRSG